MTTATTFSVRPPPRARRAMLSLHLLVAMSLIAWTATLFVREAWGMMAWLLPSCLAWLLAAGWEPLAAGRLRWDGQAWLLAGPMPQATPECQGNLSLVFDTGAWMLLRFRRGRNCPGWPRDVWLVLGRDGSAGDWCALRRAVYSPRPDPAGPSAQAPEHLFA